MMCSFFLSGFLSGLYVWSHKSVCPAACVYVHLSFGCEVSRLSHVSLYCKWLVCADPGVQTGDSPKQIKKKKVSSRIEENEQCMLLLLFRIWYLLILSSTILTIFCFVEFVTKQKMQSLLIQKQNYSHLYCYCPYVSLVVTNWRLCNTLFPAGEHFRALQVGIEYWGFRNMSIFW